MRCSFQPHHYKNVHINPEASARHQESTARSRGIPSASAAGSSAACKDSVDNIAFSTSNTLNTPASRLFQFGVGTGNVRRAFHNQTPDVNGFDGGRNDIGGRYGRPHLHSSGRDMPGDVLPSHVSSVPRLNYSAFTVANRAEIARQGGARDELPYDATTQGTPSHIEPGSSELQNAARLLRLRTPPALATDLRPEDGEEDAHHREFMLRLLCTAIEPMKMAALFLVVWWTLGRFVVLPLLVQAALNVPILGSAGAGLRILVRSRAVLYALTVQLVLCVSRVVILTHEEFLVVPSVVKVRTPADFLQAVIHRLLPARLLVFFRYSRRRLRGNPQYFLLLLVLLLYPHVVAAQFSCLALGNPGILDVCFCLGTGLAGLSRFFLSYPARYRLKLENLDNYAELLLDKLQREQNPWRAMKVCIVRVISGPLVQAVLIAAIIGLCGQASYLGLGDCIDMARVFLFSHHYLILWLPAADFSSTTLRIALMVLTATMFLTMMEAHDKAIEDVLLSHCGVKPETVPSLLTSDKAFYQVLGFATMCKAAANVPTDDFDESARVGFMEVVAPLGRLTAVTSIIGNANVGYSRRLNLLIGPPLPVWLGNMHDLEDIICGSRARGITLIHPWRILSLLRRSIDSILLQLLWPVKWVTKDTLFRDLLVFACLTRSGRISRLVLQRLTPGNEDVCGILVKALCGSGSRHFPDCAKIPLEAASTSTIRQSSLFAQGILQPCAIHPLCPTCAIAAQRQQPPLVLAVTHWIGSFLFENGSLWSTFTMAALHSFENATTVIQTLNELATITLLISCNKARLDQTGEKQAHSEKLGNEVDTENDKTSRQSTGMEEIRTPYPMRTWKSRIQKDDKMSPSCTSSLYSSISRRAIDSERTHQLYCREGASPSIRGLWTHEKSEQQSVEIPLSLVRQITELAHYRGRDPIGSVTRTICALSAREPLTMDENPKKLRLSGAIELTLTEIMALRLEVEEMAIPFLTIARLAAKGLTDWARLTKLITRGCGTQGGATTCMKTGVDFTAAVHTRLWQQNLPRSAASRLVGLQRAGHVLMQNSGNRQKLHLSTALSSISRSLHDFLSCFQEEFRTMSIPTSVADELAKMSCQL